MIRVEGYGWEEERGTMEKGDRESMEKKETKQNKTTGCVGRKPTKRIKSAQAKKILFYKFSNILNLIGGCSTNFFIIVGTRFHGS